MPSMYFYFLTRPDDEFSGGRRAHAAQRKYVPGIGQYCVFQCQSWDAQYLGTKQCFLLANVESKDKSFDSLRRVLTLLLLLLLCHPDPRKRTGISPTLKKNRAFVQLHYE